MGRKQTISRETLLDLAEEIVRRDGAGALTIASLAEAGGISKGGVQYSFASKDEIVTGIIDRWTDQIETLLGAIEDVDDPILFVRRYIQGMRASARFIDTKLAGLMMLYMRNPENLAATQAWYRDIMARLAGGDARSQMARVTFLAVEGLFLMRINGLQTGDVWNGLLDDIEAQLDLC